MSVSELEKTNLAAHAELAAGREETLRVDMQTLKDRVDQLIEDLNAFKEVIDKLKDDRNSQLIAWGSAIIVMLVSALGALLLKILLPLILK